jgi:UDP-N-acetylglucosamine 1-carboxyvinyltransferase
MEKLILEGGRPLEGKVRLSGAKNAALPILAATLLTQKEVRLKAVPDLVDIRRMMDLLRLLGSQVEREEDGTVTICSDGAGPVIAPYELVSKMRASICVLGPLLARRGNARVSMPGGCAIGVRPIDLHIKGMRALGADITLEKGYVVASSERLQGAEIYLGGPSGSSVTGTANVLMASVLAQGQTIIENAACEPEVADLAHFLQALGARIDGIGSPRIVVEGVEELAGTEYSIIPDRIEAGTLIAAAAVTGGNVLVENPRVEHMGAIVYTMREMGVRLEREGKGLRVSAGTDFRPLDITTLPYPGFPTDMQAQVTSLLTVADGISLVSEKIYPDRFMHVPELNRMGASIRKEGGTAIIKGVRQLTGAEVMASDLRASACLVIAGMVARGSTEVHRLYHMDRGYEKLENKLAALGARIRRVEE